MRAAPAPNYFELGMMLGLRSVEKLGQAQQAYGWNPVAPFSGAFAAAQRETPLPTKPETVRELSAALLADLEEVRATLEQVDGEPDPFVVDLRELWFDLNGNGTRDGREEAEMVLGQIVQGWRFQPPDVPSQEPLEVRFDAADLYWLTAYTHALSGMANIVLAFDPEPVLSRLEAGEALVAEAPTKAYDFDFDALEKELSVLVSQAKASKERLVSLDREWRGVRVQLNGVDKQIAAASDVERPVLEAEQAQLRKRLQEAQALVNEARQEELALRDEIDAIEAKFPPTAGSKPSANAMLAARTRETYKPIVTALYLLLETLDQKPDAERLQAAREHLLEVIAFNRLYWPAIAAETDNDREWIPNANQTGPLGIVLEPRAGESWLKVLDDAEAVLQGRLLIPHPLLPDGMGIDLDAYLADPVPLDLTGWIQGISAYPYAARGPWVTDSYWRAFGNMVQGRAGLHAVYFN